MHQLESPIAPTNPRRAFISAGILIVVSLLTMVLAFPTADLLSIPLADAYVIGNFFAHGTLASAWAALGPGRVRLRLLLSLAWISLPPLTVFIYIAGAGGPFAPIMASVVCLLGQWLLVQLALWSLAFRFGIQLAHKDDQNMAAQRLRFGMSQLLLVMALIGVALAIGRIVVGHLPSGFDDQLFDFAFFAVAAITITLPILLAMLVPHATIPCVVVSVVCAVVFTAAEVAFLDRAPLMYLARAEGIIVTNFVSAALVIGVAFSLRLNGYSLRRREAVSE